MPTQAVTGSDRFLFGCAMVFGVLFAAGCLLAVFLGVRANASVAIIIGAVFTVIGVLAIIVTRRASSMAARTDALKAANPDKPWMWREEWATAVINDTSKSRTAGIWIFAVLWNGFSFPLAIMMVRQSARHDPAVLLILLFPLVGVILLISAIYQTLRGMRFGTSKCRLERVPIVPGRLFRGDLELNTQLVPENGFHLRIASVHLVTRR